VELHRRLRYVANESTVFRDAAGESIRDQVAAQSTVKEWHQSTLETWVSPRASTIDSVEEKRKFILPSRTWPFPPRHIQKLNFYYLLELFGKQKLVCGRHTRSPIVSIWCFFYVPLSSYFTFPSTSLHPSHRSRCPKNRFCCCLSSFSLLSSPMGSSFCQNVSSIARKMPVN
jgi:hypothetical protein